MTLTTYSNIGTKLFWLGVVTIVASISLFLASGRGVSIGNPDELHLHDTYYIIFSWGHRLILLLPMIAGVLLVTTGLQARRQASAIDSELQRIEEAQKAAP